MIPINRDVTDFLFGLGMCGLGWGFGSVFPMSWVAVPLVGVCALGLICVSIAGCIKASNGE